ncbi:MAG: galactokinase [Sphingobacteriales bacterium]|nr:MAG: galactokinase [Sphingobacteriales bacterium]
MNEIASKLQQVFKEKYNSDPTLYFSPGRINLIGEHIDYNDGYVMPAAIDKGVYYAVAVNNSHAANFYAVDFTEEFSIEVNKISKADGWKNYVLSVVNEFLLLHKNINGFDCVMMGDIPHGSGMSSSAAVEGGLAFALNDLFNCGLDKLELALLCQRAEHNYPGVQCGIMDQFANMMGKRDHVILLDCQHITHAYFPLQLNDYEIILVNSKVHHSLASSAYNERRRQCEEGLMMLKETLNIHSFRDVGKWEDLLSMEKMLDESVFMRCKYVVQEIGRTRLAAELLQQNKLFEFGQLMYQTHEGLSKLYEVSCAELDFLVDFASKNPAVIGSRLMGGGFGGCTINLVHKDLLDKFSDAIKIAYKHNFNISAEIYIVKTADGCMRIN